MKSVFFRIFPILIFFSFCEPSFSQVKTQREILQRDAITQAGKEKSLRQQLETLAKEKGWPLRIEGKNKKISVLSGIDELGYPLYLTTYNNTTAAATIGTNTLWPGGSTGLNLSGSSPVVKDKLAVWDVGRVRNTHVELTGRVVQRDNPSSIEDHSTFVAGTLIATGVNPAAKGMSFADQELVAYDFNNDNSEMMNESGNLLVSSHSYGSLAGWVFNEDENRWEFYGSFGANEDYKFGYYSSKAQMWDSISYNAPYYLIVQAAGNNRNSNGPAVGSPYWRYNASNIMVDAGNRPAGMSSNDGYDIIPGTANAKNILLVGAVNPIPGGYNSSSDVVMSSFSSWGPTDDGRIKPDVVADGVNLLSCIGTSDNAYAVFSGTSMSTPTVAGSLLLLQEYYAKLHSNSFMRSATLRGLVIHTADEAGPAPGPDYQFGWGLVNIKKAASVITSNNTDQVIEENVLNNGASYTKNVVASGKGPLIVTICWTDPKGTVIPVANALNNPERKLVNDLDVRVTIDTNVFRPWILNPGNPSAAATTGDNNTDNVEKIVINNPVPGATYTITVTHKGTLQRGSQAYSLLISGVGGHAFCNSAATNSQGARIDSVSIGTIRNQNPAGCTTYNNFTKLTTDIQSGQTLPVYIKLNSCDGSSADKIVKIFIDFNNNGSFTDPGENVATSGVINGDGVFSTNITIPAGLTVDNYSLIRIVMQETNNANNVNPCGSYTRGETQDYRVHFATPTNDVGMVELVAPLPGDCAAGSQLVVVRIHNFGTAAQSNIPVTALVKQGSNTLLNISTNYPGTVAAGSDVIYTFQSTFASVPGTEYNITVGTNLSNDVNSSNNQFSATIKTGSGSDDPSGSAEICGTNQVFLKAVKTGSDVFSWYETSGSTSPIAGGANAVSSTITNDHTYYLQKNDINLRLAPANKNVLAAPADAYNEFAGNFIKFSTSVPLTIESSRLYVRSAGKIKFTVGILASFSAGSGSYSYYPVTTTTIDVYPTSPNPAGGAQPNDPADSGAIYYLNLPVTSPGSYIMIVECQNGANSFRNSNSSQLYNYPFSLPGVMSITGNSAVNVNDTTDATFFKHYYYFFYNTSFRLASCSSNRVPVVATTAVAPVITQSGNVLSSSFATGNQWYMNGSPVSGATNKDYTATASGVYSVLRTDSAGCSLASNQINFSVTATTDPNDTPTGFSILPNPSRGEFTLRYTATTRSDMDIILTNSLGQQVYHSTLPAVSGSITKQIDPGELATGIYYLKVKHDKKTFTRKLVITK